MTTFIPRRNNGSPAPGFGARGLRASMNSSMAAVQQGGMYGYAGMQGMGDMLPMDQVAAAQGGGAWQGPWMSMDQMQPQQQEWQPPMQQGGFNDWVVTGPQVYPTGDGGGSFLTMPEYQQATAPRGVSGMGFISMPDLGGLKFVGILAGVALAWWYFMGRAR
jgi:hypothetical protein